MKKRNPPSDVPRARTLLYKGLETRDWDYVVAALSLMTRAKAVRRAKRKQQPITAAQKRMVKQLVADTDLHMHEIANRVGLANGGRVSEIANNLRK